MSELLSEMWNLLRERRKMWLLPIVLILCLFGALMIGAQGSAVAPFIYAFF